MPRIIVEDVVTTANFYRDKLGFDYDRFWGEPPCFCMVRRSGVVIMLGQLEERGLMRPNGTVEGDSGPWDAYVWVDDADELYSELRSKGVTIAREICERDTAAATSIFWTSTAIGCVLDRKSRDNLIRQVYGLRGQGHSDERAVSPVLGRADPFCSLRRKLIMPFKVASQQRGSNRINRSPAKTASSTRVHQPHYHLQRMIGNSATSRLLSINRIQTKLTVSNPNDSAEREADRFADQVMRVPESQSGVALQRSSLAMQRKCAQCEENPQPLPEETERIAQAKPADTSAEPQATGEIESQVNRIRGGGQPLPASSQAYFASRLGYDFSHVRIHTDSQANESARAINAKAYTIGNDIVFASGQHSPDSQQGQRLLAHELVHVVQQSGSQASTAVQRSVQEGHFPGGGRVDDVRPGEHLLWNFDIGQHTLRPEHAAPVRRIAAEIKGALLRDPSALIDVEGQASFTGTRNDELSTKRAESVKKALVNQGIAADRLNIISAGSLKSLPGESQENFARSRGVRVITPPHLLLPVGPQPTQPQTGPCQAQASNMVLDGGTVDVTDEGLFKRIHAGDGNPPGMIMSSGVSVNPPDCGDLIFVQNVQAFRQIIYKDRTRNTLQTPGFVLDTEDPYPTQVFDGKDPNNPGLKVAMANDSPAQRIHTGFDLEPMMKVVEARDDFRMFLLFVPKGGNRQVLQIGEWSWSGQLNSTQPDSLTEGSLVKDGSASRIMPTSGKGRPTAEVPVLAPNVTSSDWVTNNAGLQKTFADLHRPLLNRVKPRANSK